MKEARLEGRRFGKLVAVKKVDRRWECVCDCGEKRRLKASYLLSGHTTSCGCKHNPNLTGRKFTRLTVLRLLEVNRVGKKIWECRCDCGRVRTAVSSSLLSGKTTSCGCKKRDDAIARQWKGCGDISGSFWRRIINQARLRNFTVEITIQDAWDLFVKQDAKCELTGLPLKFVNGGRNLSSGSTASLDRIDSGVGYTKDNIQWVHKDVNQMKMDMDQNRFVEMCRLVVNNDDERKVA